MTTGAAATSRCARKYTAEATRSNTTPTKNTRRPSRSRSIVFTEDAAIEDMTIGQKYLEEASRKCQRVFGPEHFLTETYQRLAFVASRMSVYVQAGVPYTGAWTLREGTKSGDVPFEPKWAK
jgi:hypothetical protein